MYTDLVLLLLLDPLDVVGRVPAVKVPPHVLDDVDAGLDGGVELLPAMRLVQALDLLALLQAEQGVVEGRPDL